MRRHALYGTVGPQFAQLCELLRGTREVLEFLVDTFSPDGLLLGRNGDCDIPVGTMFTAIRKRRVRMDSGVLGTEELGEVGRVALDLREVHWYQRVIDHVPRGHTAGLLVTGEGLEHLAGLLRSLPRNEYLFLIAAKRQDSQLMLSAP